MKNEQTATIIKNLCKLKGISISNLLLECDIRKSLIYDMEKRDCAPSAEILEKIADHLNCSVDYLLGRTDIMEINNTNKKLLKKDWNIILSAFVTTYECKDKYKSLIEKIHPTYEEVQKFADGCAVNVDFFYCDGEKRVNSDYSLINKGTHDDLTELMIKSYNYLHGHNKKLSNDGKLTDKTTTYQLLYHFVNGTYGYNSDVVDNVFNTEIVDKDLFFKFLENYEEAYNDNLLWEKYGNKQPLSKETEYSQSVLNAANSGDKFNTKPFTPEQEAYIDKLIDKKNNE